MLVVESDLLIIRCFIVAKDAVKLLMQLVYKLDLLVNIFQSSLQTKDLDEFHVKSVSLLAFFCVIF